MIVDAFRKVLLRDIEGVRREIAAYPDDVSIWSTRRGMTNSAGTLVLHLAGSLQHHLGALYGGTGYVRQRDSEFSRRDVPRATLLAELDAAGAAVVSGLERMTDADLAEPFAQEVGGVRPPLGHFLVHVAAHLAWHLGQVDYHRRAVTGDPGKIGALSPTALG